jgi:hypothetical protein
MPARATGFRLVTDVEPCARLENGSPSGVVVEPDGTKRAPRTRFGVAWIVDARLTGSVIAWFERQADAHRLLAILRGDAPAPRSAPVIPAGERRGPLVEPDQELIEAPDGELPGVSLPTAPTAPTAPTGRSSKSTPARSVLEPTPVSGTAVRLCAGCDEPLPVDARPNRTTHDGVCRVAAARRRAAEKAQRPDADGGAGDVTVSRASDTPDPNQTTSADPAGSPDRVAEVQLALPAPAP